MSTPRIAVSQSSYLRDSEGAIRRCLENMRHAASRGVDVIVFPEWSLGLNPVEVVPNRNTERLSRLARELNLMVITGSIRVLEPESGKKQQRCLVFEPDGTLAGSHAKVLFHPTERPWFEPGAGINAISTRWGRVVVLPGLDGVDQDSWSQALELSPDLVVMATSPHTPTERTHLQELAIVRSQDIQATVVLAPLKGRFSGSAYLGGALIAHEGRVLGMADEQETILIAGDPEAPLIQLGVVDSTAYVPVTHPLEETWDAKKALGPEAERRVLVDWGLLADPESGAHTQELLTLAEDNPRWTALAPARPGYSAVLGRWLDAGAGGAFVYPGLQRQFPWAEPIRQIGCELARVQRPLLIHTGPGPAPLRFDDPILWDEFLMEFRTFPVIIQSMGQRSPHIEHALILAERHPQVYLETSKVSVAAIQEAIRIIGADRIMFGSGGYAQEFHQEWEKMERLEPEISEEAFQKIVNLNARRLFFHSESLERRLPGKVHPFRRPS